MSANAENTPAATGQQKGKRKSALILLTLLFIIIAVAYGIYWFLVLRHVEETDDAYVAGNQVQIMAQVSGSVTKVWADNTDFVKKAMCWSRSIQPTPNRLLKKHRRLWPPAFARPAS